MKILLVQDHLRLGGTERQTISLAHAFSKAGHDVTLMTFRPGGGLLSQLQPALVTHIALQHIDTGLDWYAPRLRSKARQIAPDVVLCMGRLANCRGATFAATLPSAKVIATVRTGKPLPFLFQRSLRRVAVVVANSRATNRRLQQDYKLPLDRIRVIYNGLLTSGNSKDVADRESIRVEHGATTATTVLVCAAMFRAEKKHDELLTTLAPLRTKSDWQLWLIGDGSTRKRCEKLSRKLGLLGQVKFLGALDDPTRFFAAADLAVLTSRYESLSNFLIEAQFSGLPFIAYEAHGIEECGSLGRSCFVIPRGDAAQFRAELVRLMDNPLARITAADAARTYAAENFAQEKQTSAYIRLFDEITVTA